MVVAYVKIRRGFAEVLWPRSIQYQQIPLIDNFSLGVLGLRKMLFTLCWIFCLVYILMWIFCYVQWLYPLKWPWSVPGMSWQELSIWGCGCCRVNSSVCSVSAIFTVSSFLCFLSLPLAAFLSCCGYCSEYLDLQLEGTYDGDLRGVPNIHLTSHFSR